MPLDDPPDPAIDLAQASEITGESHPDHNSVSLTVMRRNGARATLSIPGADLQRLVPLLLLLGRALPHTPAMADAPLSLVPTDSLHVGPLPSGETLLAVGIGPATVGLSLPASAVEKLAHSLLAAVAKPERGRIQ